MLRDMALAFNEANSSAVMKTTVFHESISDWLIPWYHYIPINYDYIDMYSVLLYFFGDVDAGQPGHDDELKAIADRSQVWADSHLELSHQAVSAAKRQRVDGADSRRIHIDYVLSGRELSRTTGQAWTTPVDPMGRRVDLPVRLPSLRFLMTI
jgi:hypothetical protein